MKRALCILLSLGLLLVVASAVTAQSAGCKDAAGGPIPCPDRDGDGVQDNDDRCISDAGPATNNGCPESTQGQGSGDADGDGVIDSSDQCATAAGTTEYAGCPGPSPTPVGDSDADGENDAIDRCINQPGPASNGGCPVETVPVATIQPTERPIAAPTFPESDVCLAVARMKAQNNLKQMGLANAPVVGTFPEGEFVPLLSAVINDAGEKWFETENGYVLSDAIVPSDDCDDLPTERLRGSYVFPANEGICQIVSTVGVNVRAEPSFNAAVVSSLVPGQFYAVMSAAVNAEGTWYRVEAGWVSASVVAIDGQCSLRIVKIEPSGFSIAQADYDQVEGGISPESHCFDLFNGIRYCHTVLVATADEDDDGSTEGLVPWGVTTCGFGPAGVVCILNEFVAFEPDECPPEFCEPADPNPYPGPNPNDPDSNGAVYCKTLLNDLAFPIEGDNNPYYTVQNPDGSVGFGLRLPPLDPQTCLIDVYMVRQEGGANGLLPIDRFVLEIDFPPPAAAYDAFMKLDGIDGESSADRPAKPSMTLFNVIRLDQNGGVCIPVAHGNFTACPKPQ